MKEWKRQRIHLQWKMPKKEISEKKGANKSRANKLNESRREWTEEDKEKKNEIAKLKDEMKEVKKNGDWLEKLQINIKIKINYFWRKKNIFVHSANLCWIALVIMPSNFTAKNTSAKSK